MQNLNVSNAGGDEEFLNFFSELSEQWRLGFVLVGTPNIIPTLEKTFTAGRRLTSGGDMHFERFQKNDAKWKNLITTLWPYQYVNQPVDLYDKNFEIIDTKLFDQIYKMTQGIPFVFTFLFIHTQILAIASPDKNGNESIGVKQWTRAYNESSSLIKRAIEDILNNGGKDYPDLMNQAQYFSAPEKTEFFIKIQNWLAKKSIPKSKAQLLLQSADQIEGRYILNDEEVKLLDRIKDLIRVRHDNPKAHVIEGEYKEVK